MSNLISDYLRKSRILIIIDDIDRCSPEKVKSYLFLMKEFATMNCCIAIFLADVAKLKKTCDLDEVFFEKFFNCSIHLVTVNFNEIISSLKEINAEATDLEQEMQKTLKQFDKNIAETEKDSFLFIPDYQKCKKYREQRINAIKEDKRQFGLDLSNPRRVGKVVEYYSELISKINNQLNDLSSEEHKTVIMFLEKVDYKKQLSLLSIIYGLYNSEFSRIQQNGIYRYVGTFSSRCKQAESTQETIHRVNSLIENEWCLGGLSSNDFKIQEALRFVSCVLTDIRQLANISNGYNSLEEKQISMINSGELPNDIAFPDLVEGIYTATYKSFSQREQLIKKIFDLLLQRIGTNSVDDAFALFENNNIGNILSSETPVLKIFFEIFCSDNCHLANPERVRSSFNSFAGVYLCHNGTSFSRYFFPVSSPDEEWNNANM